MTAVHDDRRTKVASFYSNADGVGRSCMVANISLILASRGNRVLVVDLDLENPALYRYLTAFLPSAQVGRPVTSPVRLACDFVDPRGSVDFMGPTTDTGADPAGLTVQRADLTGGGYDFVLVDTPAGPGSAALTTALADVLVLGYSLNKQAMDKAVRYARDIEAGARGDAIQLLPVPMKVDQNAGGLTSRMQIEGRRQFAWLLASLTDEARQRYWNEIEIPYEPDYAIEEGLPFLDDFSDQRERLVAAYGRLADLLAPGPAGPARTAITDRARARYRDARAVAAGGNTVVTVLHAAADRYWAEWLVSELRRMELAATRSRIDQADPAAARASSELIVVSSHLLALPGGSDHLSAVAGPPPGRQVQLGVSIDGSRLPPGRFPELGYIDVAGKSAREAREELASYYQVPGSGASAPSQLYYPARAEKLVSNLPPREGICYGRDDAIDQIRDNFTVPGGDGRLTLTGPPGIGKSRLALEYAYRYAAGYDLVLRIPANSLLAVRAGLATLAELDPPEHLGGDAGLSALAQLQAESTEEKRWLLIYDGADSVVGLEDLLPEAGHGHVLLTTRDAGGDSSGQLTVGALVPDDASALLAGLIPGVLPAEAAPIANVLGGVPLALRLAAGWLTGAMDQLLRGGVRPAVSTSEAIERLRGRLAETADSGPLTDPAHVVVDLLTELLTSARRGAAAILLLDTCAFLAPSGLSRRLLRSPAMLAQLAEADSDIADPVVVHNVLRTLVSYGFSVLSATAQEPLQLHPRVMEILRDRMSAEQRVVRAAAVTRMLAGSAPLDIDDDVIGHAGIYGELLPHVEPSGAMRETDPVVRRWLVNQVRFLWQTETVSAWQTAADLGERLVLHWSATAPDKDDDLLLLRLRTQLANVYRSMCMFGKAFAIDSDVLFRQRRLLGVRHLRTLMTARSYGADLRLVGNFEDALLEDQSTWQAFAQVLGHDHLMTIIASSNLALSELVYGDPEQALERQRADIARCQRIAPERPWQEPWMLFHVGTLLRELGRYDESRDRLSEARMGFADLVEKGDMAPTVWVVLRTDAGLAITRRRLGEPRLAETERALEDGLNTYGSDYPDVLALRLSRAGDLHATGRHDEAVGEAKVARQGYRRVFEATHPFTRLCEVDLSIYALTAGDLDMADAMSQAAMTSLEESLVSGHLWSLAAAVARANVLAMTGRLEEARALEERTLAGYQRRLGSANPLTKIAGINASVTRMLLNDPEAVTDNEAGMRRRQAIELDTPPY